MHTIIALAYARLCYGLCKFGALTKHAGLGVLKPKIFSHDIWSKATTLTKLVLLMEHRFVLIRIKCFILLQMQGTCFER